MRLAPLRLSPDRSATLVGEHLAGRDPALVYLHGLFSVRAGEKSEALLAFARARGLQGCRFDFRGHGESSGELGTVTLGELIEDAATVLRHTGGGILVGSSLGGLVAAWTAAHHLELVHGLLLMAPALDFLPRLRASETEDGTVAFPGGREVRFHPRVFEDLERRDEGALPSQVRPPVMIVHGECDDTVPADVSRRFFEAIPHDRKDLWIVPGGDHRLNRPIDEIYRRAQTFFGL